MRWSSRQRLIELTSDEASTSSAIGPDRTVAVAADRAVAVAPGWTKPTVGVEAAADEAAASGTHAVMAHARVKRRTGVPSVSVVVGGKPAPFGRGSQRQRGERAQVIDTSAPP